MDKSVLLVISFA